MAPVSPYLRRLNAGSKQNEVGWLVFDKPKTRNTSTPASLQTFALPVLAKALPDYIEANGVQAVRDVMGLLPSDSLAALSIICSEMGIMSLNIMAVLCHSHAQRLAVYFQETVHEEDWISIVSLDTSHDLERLELVNVSISNRGIVTLIRLAPSLIQLSLSRSKITGASIDFLPLFQNLHVLDISHCDWIEEDFVRKLCPKASNLQLISMHHCQHLGAIDVIIALNFYTRGHPVCSIKLQSKERSYSWEGFK